VPRLLGSRTPRFHQLPIQRIIKKNITEEWAMMSKIHNLVKALNSNELRELVSQLKANQADLPLKKTDAHARFMFLMTSQLVGEWIPRRATDVGVPTQSGKLEKFEFMPGINFAPLDEDAPPAQDEAEEASKVTPIDKIMSSVRSLPLLEDLRQWEDKETADKAIADHLIDIQPRPLSVWSDVTSDTTITNLAFQGLAAHLLMQVSERAPVAFEVDLAWMGELVVRDGNELMGATASFDEDRKLLSIYVSGDDVTYFPGDELWEHAKWHWRCAVFAYVTVADHLSGLHFGLSEVMMQATREQLPADHPLRRLLKPHVYNVSTVNTRAALVLAPEGGIAHRLWPFSFDGLATLLRRGIETASFEPFPEWLKNRGLDNLSDECYPYATDGLALQRICCEYVENYLDIYFPGESVVSDTAVQAWWRQLETTAPQAGLSNLKTKEQVVNLLGQFIFAASGYHSQVGAVTQYVLDQSFMGAKVRVGSEFSDIQSTVETLTLNAATGLDEPKLLDDYTHIFLELHNEQAVEVFRQFQNALIALGGEIDSRNESRSMPMRTFHPAELDAAVSK